MAAVNNVSHPTRWQVRSPDAVAAAAVVDRRAARWRGLQVLWRRSTLKRVRICRRRRSAGAEVEVVVNAGTAHYRGVQTCGSVWVCPMCSARILATRATEVESALVRHLAGWVRPNGLRAARGSARFVTLTVPHDAGDDLAALWDTISDGFARVLGGRGWMADRERYAVKGTIRATEVTHGANGWHPHLHVLVLSHAVLTEDEWQALVRSMGARWRSAVVAAGWRRPLGTIGVHNSAVSLRAAKDLARYVCKVEDEAKVTRSLGNEMTRHDLKVGRRKGRGPFSILADAIATGDVDDLELWQEWERVSKGRRGLCWSKGLKAALAVDEVSDAAAAAAEVGGDAVMVVPSCDWALVVGTMGAPVGLLAAVEAEGEQGGREFISALWAAAVPLVA